MRILVAAVLLATSCCAGSLQGYSTYSDRTQYEAAVQVFVLCPEGPVLGSGVVINARQALTAGHVIECGPIAAMAVTRDGDMFPVEVSGQIEGVDVARLSAIDGEPFKVAAPIRRSKLRIGERVCSIGTDGNLVTGIRKCGDVGEIEGDVFSMAIPGVPGNSGSPVYDRDGYVVGILVAAQWGEGLEHFSVGVTVSAFVGLL